MVTTWWPFGDHFMTTLWPLADHLVNIKFLMSVCLIVWKCSFLSNKTQHACTIANVYDCFTMQSLLWPIAHINGGVGSAFHRMKINIYIYRVGANIWIPGTLIRNWFSKSESLIHDLDKVEALKGKGANATYRHHCTFTLEVHGTTQYIKCHFGACSNTKNRVCSNTKKVCSNTQNRSLKEMQHCTTCT